MEPSDNRHGRWHPKEWRDDHDAAESDPSVVWTLVIALGVAVTVLVEVWLWRH